MSKMPSTTATATIDITCPSWCTTDDVQEHADELWQAGGCVIHNHAGYVVADEQGHTPAPLTNAVVAKPVHVTGGIETTPDGLPQATPMVNLDGVEMTPQQALAVAAGLAMVVADLTQPVTGSLPVYEEAHPQLYALAEMLDALGRSFIQTEVPA